MGQSTIDLDADTPPRSSESESLRERLAVAERRLEALGNRFSELRDRVVALETEREQVREELKNRSFRDPYTGFANRRQFMEDLEFHFRTRSSDRTPSFAVGLLRLAQAYRRANYNLNRVALVAATGMRIQGVLQELGLSGENPYISDRMDEFYLVFPISDAAYLHATASRIAEEVSKPYPGGRDLMFGCSVGLAVAEAGIGVAELLENADIALAESERSGHVVVMYEAGMGQAYRNRTVMERHLRGAIHQAGFDGFSLRYQPIVNRDRQIVAAEVLMRWLHVGLGNVKPAEFIPLAEQTGQIRYLGNWSMYQAARQLRAWHQAGHRDLALSINLSASQFAHPDLIDRVQDTISLVGANSVVLELTETSIMDDVDGSIRKMEALRTMGVSISIDDFGTGYSSLSHLRRFPIDTLKIDQTFIRDVHRNRSNQQIVKAVITMAKGFGMVSMAEGEETREELEFLFDHGCDKIQGFYFSWPLPAGEFGTLLARGA